jgi:predicted ArsR family transcriptional regulator
MHKTCCAICLAKLPHALVRKNAQVPDPTVLRALAHPVRGRILSELSAQGSLRAADVARELGIPANQASFHLRQLAKYGLVEEDPGAGRDRRDRVWRATSEDGQDIDLRAVAAQPGGAAAARVFRGQASARAHQLVDQLYAERQPGDARHVALDAAVRLSDEEAAALGEELDAVVKRWAARTRGRGDLERRTYSVFTMVQPEP